MSASGRTSATGAAGGRATAVAHANIALVKYWGKRDDALLLPEAPSLSLALDKLLTTTTVQLGSAEDSLLLDGAPAQPGELAKARALLDAAGIAQPAHIESRNDFPTGAGLASSASGFAALAVAACAAAGQRRSLRELSALARLGSGSASRSVPGGWAVWRDDSAEQVFPPGHLDARMVVAVCASGPKAVGSRDGMRATRETSPYHAAWIEQCKRDLPQALRLLGARDLSGLGRLAESNALRMHANALAAEPPLLYWQPATVGCLRAIAALRQAGTPAFATIDAGPHVVALCATPDAGRVEAALAAVPGVTRAFACAPAGEARVVEAAA
jgi:diphosphomevalonate decarboxylase